MSNFAAESATDGELSVRVRTAGFAVEPVYSCKLWDQARVPGHSGGQRRRQRRIPLENLFWTLGGRCGDLEVERAQVARHSAAGQLAEESHLVVQVGHRRIEQRVQALVQSRRDLETALCALRCLHQDLLVAFTEKSSAVAIASVLAVLQLFFLYVGARPVPAEGQLPAPSARGVGQDARDGLEDWD